jgi:molybdopterin-biosynthesis enzyme MoeA-like protein
MGCMHTPAPTAAMLVIGDEILSGRTQDTNTNYLARFLGSLGIDLKEARVVPDVGRRSSPP